MRFRSAVAIPVLLAALTTAEALSAQTTPTIAEMAVMCSHDTERATQLELTQKAICAGFVRGMLDAHAIMVGFMGSRPFFCVPKEGVENNTAISTFVAWSLRNRDDWQQPARLGFMLAMREGYPCPHGK